jgi:hypothetical protein
VDTHVAQIVLVVQVVTYALDVRVRVGVGAVTVVVVLTTPEYAVTGAGVLHKLAQSLGKSAFGCTYTVAVTVATSVSISVLVGAVTVTYDDTTLVVWRTVVVQTSRRGQFGFPLSM